jgi:REP element-mobilizing transposase RayT
MILGTDKPLRTAAPVKKKTLESPYDVEEARRIAEELVRGKSPKILSAAGLSDVIHALTEMQVQAMEDGNYKEVDHIRSIVQNLRTDHRHRDRVDLHEGRIALLNGKLAEAQQKLGETQKLYSSFLTLRWKAREAALKGSIVQEAKDLDEQHTNELLDCTLKLLLEYVAFLAGTFVPGLYGGLSGRGSF